MKKYVLLKLILLTTVLSTQNKDDINILKEVLASKMDDSQISASPLQKKNANQKKKTENAQEGEYTTLKDKVVDLLKQYQEKYPECIYIPPQLIPDEGMHIKKESKVCKENFRRGWVMGTNWAKLFFMNGKLKEEGWDKLQETGNFFLQNSESKKSEFECAYRGMKKGYFNNFELLEDNDEVIHLQSYDDFVKVKYDNLDTYYKKLQAKVNDEEVPETTLSMRD